MEIEFKFCHFWPSKYFDRRKFGQFSIHMSISQNFIFEHNQRFKISPQKFSYQKLDCEFSFWKSEKNENSMSAKKFRDSVDFGWVLDDVMRQLVTLNILVWSRTGSDNRMEVRIRDVFNFISAASLNIWVDQIFCPRLIFVTDLVTSGHAARDG